MSACTVTRITGRPVMRRRLAPALAAVALVLAGGCKPVDRFHGYVPDDADLGVLTIGQTHESEVATLLGRPPTQGLLTGSDWFYIGSTFRHSGAMKPREINREVVALSFDSGGRLANVERFGLEDGRIVVLSRRVTDPGVSGMSALRQMLGNIGQITAGQILD